MGEICPDYGGRHRLRAWEWGGGHCGFPHPSVFITTRDMPITLYWEMRQVFLNQVEASNLITANK
jgi:hypothetical protein